MTDDSIKASESMTPDSQKSYLEQAKEKITGATDSMAKDGQSDSSKSGTQAAADKMTR